MEDDTEEIFACGLLNRYTKRPAKLEQCFCVIRSHTDCALLQDDINKLIDWSDNWKQAFNINKCLICNVINKCTPIICNYKMEAKTLSRVESQRDLGVLVSDTTSFTDNIHAQVNKANKMLGFICRSICGCKTSK